MSHTLNLLLMCIIVATALLAIVGCEDDVPAEPDSVAKIAVAPTAPAPSPTAVPDPTSTPSPTAVPDPTSTPSPTAVPELALVDAPPVAEQRPHSFTHHGITVEDPWNWLRDPDYPTVDDEDVLDYLRAENAYFDSKMEPHQLLIDTIFEEIKGRRQSDLSSVPWKKQLS